MKNALKLATLAVLAATASIGAHAAETADLAVKGTIRPSACNVAISTGEINLGTISAVTLSDTDATVLPSHNFSVTVTCDAATQVGLKAIDGRSGTIQENARAALNTVASDSYGLGAVDGTNIGAYNVRRTGNPTADGSTVALLISRNHGSTWAVHENNAPVRSWPTNSSLISWGATDGTTPGSYSSITEQFSLTPAIAPTSALPDLTNSIPLDGLATFEVRYL